MRVSFNELAERELNEAAAYSEREQPGLCAAFLDEVERAIEAITERPLASPIVDGVVRRRLCARFPYGVLYSLAGDESACLP